MKIWAIDRTTGELADVTTGDSPAAAGFAANAFVRVFDGGDPYGSTVYRSATTGRSFFFINNKVGAVEQYELAAKATPLARGVFER